MGGYGCASTCSTDGMLSASVNTAKLETAVLQMQESSPASLVWNVQSTESLQLAATSGEIPSVQRTLNVFLESAS